MIEIKIIFLIIGTFFMRENPSLIAKKAIVTVDPTQKTVSVDMLDLVAPLAKTAANKTEEFDLLEKGAISWIPELQPFTAKTCTFQEDNGIHGARISFSYAHPEDLQVMGIQFHESKFWVFKDEQTSKVTGTAIEEKNSLGFADTTPFSFQIALPADWENRVREQQAAGLGLWSPRSGMIRGTEWLETDETWTTKTNSKLFFAELKSEFTHDEKEGEVSFLDNDILVTSHNLSDKTASKTRYRYSMDHQQMRLTLIPIHADGKENTEGKTLYFVFVPKTEG
ncbi:hypothetical protein [Sphingobacterium lactis]|uniref:Uncharacterized protein n=1 Tax=Sphingobacterium lactis TaxID=797291 RepID=A0A1H5ZLS8_9SPHI|nr:hypothetical protein [Sphingobacterium lactis]SEG37478.1 hypothetical protein SAMN05421877_10781 [Sphingobacterium lactis]